MRYCVICKVELLCCGFACRSFVLGCCLLSLLCIVSSFCLVWFGFYLMFMFCFQSLPCPCGGEIVLSFDLQRLCLIELPCKAVGHIT